MAGTGNEAVMIQAYDNIVLAKVMRERVLDHLVINTIDQEFRKMIDRYPRISLVLDLSDVQYLSSMFLGKIIALFKGVQASRGRMTIAGVRGPLKPLFKATHLDKLIPFADEAEQVLLAYRRTPVF